MEHFKLVSDYRPTGDQPQAIDTLVRSINAGNKEQTLLGVTGSGKTFTMANIIERLNRPTLPILPIVHNTEFVQNEFADRYIFRRYFRKDKLTFLRRWIDENILND